MSKLHFIYGTIGCGKTVYALTRRYNYLERGKKVLFINQQLI